MLEQFIWRSLEQKGARGCPPLSLLQNGPCNCGSTAPRLRPAHSRVSRYCHSKTFRQAQTNRNYYKYSFFHWLKSSGIPCQSLLLVCMTLNLSRALCANCNIPDTRSRHYYTSASLFLHIIFYPPYLSCFYPFFFSTNVARQRTTA